MTSPNEIIIPTLSKFTPENPKRHNYEVRKDFYYLPTITEETEEDLAALVGDSRVRLRWWPQVNLLRRLALACVLVSTDDGDWQMALRFGQWRY